MIITYYGIQCVKFQVGDLILAANPISKESSTKSTRFGADVALVSLNHPDFNGVLSLSYGEREPLVIRGPGEYEIQGIPIRGFGTPSKYDDKKEKINTLYYFTFDTIDVCFLGALDSPSIEEAVLERIGNVDLLFVPIFGKGTMGPADAYKTSLLFEPKVIIPLHYDSASLKKFLEEAGTEDIKSEDRFTLKKKDLIDKEGEIMVLKAQ